MSQENKVPAALYGKHAQVRRAWRALIKRAVTMGNWNDALAGVEMIPLSQIEGGLVLDGPSGDLVGNHLLLYEVMTELRDVTFIGYDQIERSYELRRNLVLDGLNHFWFCLGLLGASALWMIEIDTFKREKRRLAVVALRGLFQHWGAFEKLDDRFLDGGGSPAPWQYWGLRAFFLCTDLGVDESELRPVRMNEPYLSPQQSADRIREWISRAEDAGLNTSGQFR